MLILTVYRFLFILAPFLLFTISKLFQIVIQVRHHPFVPNSLYPLFIFFMASLNRFFLKASLTHNLCYIYCENKTHIHSLIVFKELLKAGCVRDGKLEFKLAKLSDSKIMDKENLDPSLLFGPSKKPPSERVSSVFDMACVSETSYQRMRENVWAERAKKSLDNPTQAMLDIMKKMKTKQIPSKPRKGIKRSKSFNLGEITDNTPAMIEVLKLKKMRSVEDSSDESEVQISHIVTRPKIKFPVSITSEIINPKDTKAKRSPNRKTELQKLDSSFEEHVKRRRTRGNQKSANREIRSNLRSALNIGLSMFRTVSQSIPKFLKYE